MIFDPPILKVSESEEIKNKNLKMFQMIHSVFKRTKKEK